MIIEKIVNETDRAKSNLPLQDSLQHSFRTTRDWPNRTMPVFIIYPFLTGLTFLLIGFGRANCWFSGFVRAAPRIPRA
jgi:hypothetical protein